MKPISNKNNLLELVGTIFIPPYSLSVPKYKVTERKIEPPIGELMYIELPTGNKVVEKTEKKSIL